MLQSFVGLGIVLAQKKSVRVSFIYFIHQINNFSVHADKVSISVVILE